MWHPKWAWLLVWAWLTGGVVAKQCKTIDPCRCEMDDGSGVVDITPLGLQGAPKFKDVPSLRDGYQYSYNPCFSFTEGTCTDASVCQTQLGRYWKAGTQSSAKWSYDGKNVQVLYTFNSDLDRKSTVTYHCDPKVDSPVFVAQGDVSMGVYEFDVTSKHACPGPMGSAGALSVGSILVIIFFSTLAFYLVAGVVVNLFVRKESGAGVIPNAPLWVAMPGLIKDGCMFIVRGCKTGGTYGKL